jgi:serine/threonine protein kinase
MSQTRKRSRIKITELEGQMGRLAVEKGLITLEQFMEILSAREAEDAGAPLDLVLVSAGYITEEQAESLSREAEQAPPPLDRRSLADECRRVGEPLGRGPSGVVLRAVVPGQPAPLALKLVSRNSLNEPFIEAFACSSRKAAEIPHAGIVRVLEVELRPADLAVVSEHVDGTSLLDRVRRGGPLPLAEAADVLLQVARALGAAHRQKLVHANLKPENVFQRPDGTVKVADFGHGRATPDWLKTNADKSGSLVFSMAPEQWREAPGVGVDLYQCGVLWCFMLTGNFPFQGRTFIEIRRRHEEEDPPMPSERLDGLPSGVDALTRKLLRKDPKDRYLSAAELAAELERLQRGEPLAAEQKTKPKIRPRPKGWTRRPSS